MNPPLETAELEAFARTVEARSMTAAARELGLPRPTLGRRLVRLEQRLGVRLLRRTTRRLALTDAGATLYEHAKVVLDAARVAEDSVLSEAGLVRGDLRVSLPPLYDEALLGAVCAFAEQHPALRLSVTFSASNADLLHDADVALRSSRALEPGLVARTLSRIELRAVASREYLAHAGTPRSAAELVNHRCLVFSHSGGANLSQWPLKSGRTVRVKGALTANSYVLLRLAARRGQGIALLPSHIVDEDLDAGRLVHVLPDVVQARSGLAVVYAERRFVPPSIRAFVAAMSAFAAEGLPVRAKRSGRTRA